MYLIFISTINNNFDYISQREVSYLAVIEVVRWDRRPIKGNFFISNFKMYFGTGNIFCLLFYTVFSE